MAELQKKRETAGEIRYAHSHLGGWVAVAFGAALVYGGMGDLGGGRSWLLAGFGGLVALLGLVGALFRMELVLDRSSERYRWRRGYVFGSPEEGGGLFSDVEAVILKKELERRGSDAVDEWEVHLALPDRTHPLEVGEFKDEEPARREAEKLAALLGAPLKEEEGY